MNNFVLRTETPERLHFTVRTKNSKSIHSVINSNPFFQFLCQIHQKKGISDHVWQDKSDDIAKAEDLGTDSVFVLNFEKDGCLHQDLSTCISTGTGMSRRTLGS
jgi:hypothetical protein